MAAGMDKAYGSDLRRLHCGLCGVDIRVTLNRQFAVVAFASRPKSASAADH
jgi:hypothetical protein